MSEEKKSKWSDIRDGFAALRELMILGALLTLLLAPTLVRSILEDAGIRAVAGIEFDVNQFSDAESELEKAKREIAQLSSDLAFVQTQLPKNNVNPEDFNKVSEALKEIERQAAAAQQRVEIADGKFHEMVKRPPRNIRASSGIGPGEILQSGGDLMDGSASPNVQRAMGQPNRIQLKGLNRNATSPTPGLQFSR